MMIATLDPRRLRENVRAFSPSYEDCLPIRRPSADIGHPHPRREFAESLLYFRTFSQVEVVLFA